MAKTLVGTVSSNKPDKTIVVTVVTRRTHPIYKKQYSESKKFMAHDEKNEAMVGDKVIIAETRPLSARKRFTLEKIVERPALVASEVEKQLETATESVKDDAKVSKTGKDAKESKEAKSDKSSKKDQSGDAQ